VGHNLGLSHSNEVTQFYGDTTGMMGFSYNSDDSPKKCFNAAKSWQLGWYENQQESYDPLEYPGQTTTFVMNGINEYSTDATSSTSGDKLVGLRLENIESNAQLDYYIGYNRATGPNSQTSEAQNRIVIVQKVSGGPMTSGPSNKLAALRVGDSYTLVGADGDYYGQSVSEVIVTYESVSSDLEDAVISIRTSDLAPTESPTMFCGGDAGRFSLSITTDRYGRESSWTLTETENTDVVVAFSPLAAYDNTEEYFMDPRTNPEFCLNPCREYTFTMMDSYKDGMCCAYGPGKYVGRLDGVDIFTGGDFTASAVEKVTVGGNCDENQQQQQQTLPPTEFPTAVPTAVPTRAPTRVPTALPTNAPVVALPDFNIDSDILECTANHDEFRYKGIQKRTCDWIASRGLKKLKKMCRRSDQAPNKPIPTRIKLFVWCPQTCAAVGLGACANTNIE